MRLVERELGDVRADQRRLDAMTLALSPKTRRGAVASKWALRSSISVLSP